VQLLQHLGLFLQLFEIYLVSAGARVVLFDQFNGGGSTSRSLGVLYAGGGTPAQRAAGFQDTPENMYKYLEAEVLFIFMVLYLIVVDTRIGREKRIKRILRIKCGNIELPPTAWSFVH